MAGQQNGWLTPELLNRSPRVRFTLTSSKDGPRDPGVQLEHPRGGPLGWIRSPFGGPGDKLWVRETFHYDNAAYVAKYKDAPWLGLPDAGTAETFYRADEKNPDIFPKWTPSIFMPRWASRITLEITEVRVERLLDISETDAIAEGVRTLPAPQWHPNGWRQTYWQLWDDINGRDATKANPWVWAITFKRVT